VTAAGAAVLLVLAMAGPVAANPVDKDQFPNLYVTECADGTVVPVQSPAHAIPGWDVNWEPGGTPWNLMGYTYNINLADLDDPFSGEAVYTHPLGPGLEGKVYGPCTILWGTDTSITNAYFLKANQSHGN
jgi:hypothetical protein